MESLMVNAYVRWEIILIKDSANLHALLRIFMWKKIVIQYNIAKLRILLPVECA